MIGVYLLVDYDIARIVVVESCLMIVEMVAWRKM
jgi:hypothetical protein